MAQPKGVSDHPQKQTMREMWETGSRASSIYDWLRENDYPLVSTSTIARYGQRYWTSEIQVELDGDDGAVLGVIDAYDSMGFSIDKLTHTTKDSWGWEKDEDGANVQVRRETSSKVLSFSAKESSAGFLRAEIPPITVGSFDVSRVAKPNGMRLAVSVPDMQIGYRDDGLPLMVSTHDERAIDVAHQVISFMEQVHGVDLVVNQGDNLDLPAFSSHRSPPGYVTQRATQGAIDRYATILATQRRIAPEAAIWDLPSNHVARLTNTLIDRSPALVGVSRANSDVPVISVPYLCRFDEYGVQVPDGGYPDGHFWASDNLKFVHGSLTSSIPGGTARKYLMDRVSVVMGHCHRAEVLYNVAEVNGKAYTSFAGSAGCLCRVDGVLPSARTGSDDKGRLAGVQRETWNQGIWFIWYDPEGVIEPELEICRIENGRAIFRGVEFVSTVDDYGRLLN